MKKFFLFSGGMQRWQAGVPGERADGGNGGLGGRSGGAGLRESTHVGLSKHSISQ